MPLRDGCKAFLESEAAQGTDAWHSLRLGVLTGSRCSPVMVDESKKPSEGRKNLLMELVLERITHKSMRREISTPAMEQGLEREPAAIARFESETFDVTRRVGFVYWVGKYAGCSPDAVLGDYDGLVSIKCREAKAHYEFMRRGVVDAMARRQMAHELWITGAPTHCYVSYNPDFERKLQFGMKHYTWEALDVGAYAAAAETFLREVEVEVDVMRQLGSNFSTLGVINGNHAR